MDDGHCAREVSDEGERGNLAEGEELRSASGG